MVTEKGHKCKDWNLKGTQKKLTLSALRMMSKFNFDDAREKVPPSTKYVAQQKRIV